MRFPLIHSGLVPVVAVMSLVFACFPVVRAANSKPPVNDKAGHEPVAEKPKEGASVAEGAAKSGDGKDSTATQGDEGSEGQAEDGGEEEVAVAKPVPGDLVRVYGWREKVQLLDIEQTLVAKLDTGAATSSLHAEEAKLFERDGKKWVRFFVSDPNLEKPVRHKMEAPLVRIATIKEPGGESEQREVVRLSFQIGERKLRGEFTLNNRSNMNAPVLLGRRVLQDLGWVDASRTDLADEKIFR